MSLSYNYYNEPVLPWTSTRNDERFLRITKRVFIIFLILSVIIPFLPVPETEKKQLKQVSPRLARLITEKKKQPPKPKVIKKQSQVKKKTVKPKKKIEAARKKASQSGLMAMSQDIAELQSMFDVSSLESVKPVQQNTTRSSLPTTASVLNKNVTKGSGGINTSKLNRTTGSTALANRNRSQVNSNIGNVKAKTERRTSSGKNSRTLEELQLIFDKNKGAIFTLYTRALRKNPNIQGKVVLELTITPSGKVSNCRIISSELNSKALEKRLVLRVKTFRFKAKDVDTVTVSYPIDFLPS